MTTNRFLIMIATTAVLTAGCGGSDSTETADSTATTPAEKTISPSDMTDQQQPPDRLTIDVTISGGEVTPTDAQLQGKVGNPIVVRVTSDVTEELLAQSTTEHSFPVEAKPGQSFQFTVEQPGQVDIALRELNRTIATVDVQ